MLVPLSALGEEQAEGAVLESLLRRYTESYGGIRDENRLVTLRMEGVQIQGGAEYRIDLRRKRPEFYRYELTRGESSLTAVFDGKSGWLRTEQATGVRVEKLSGSALAGLRAEARFDSALYRHRDKEENQIALAGRQRIGSVEAYVLRVIEAERAAAVYYLHPENSRILRVDRLLEDGRAGMQTIYRDYREVGGYAFAFEIENRVDGETVSLTRLHQVLVNPGLLTVLFEAPTE